MDIKTLCAEYAPYDHRERLENIFRDFDRVLVTSSFGTTSAILLHLLHKVRPEHPIHFIDTRYHFRETHAYKDLLEDKWDLNVQSVAPSLNAHAYTRMNYTWTYEPDACCFVNKVEPLAPFKAGHDIWISGMIGGTNQFRRSMPLFREKDDMLRFYPLIDMDQEQAELYKTIFELPEHPLEAEGYGSVGCRQCTLKGAGREGRWAGFQKTECGLHKAG
ncbi:MAG: phosphoadenylyl-sulfate reductase [Bacteroidota bacterium]